MGVRVHTLAERHAVEKYVRRKNPIYNKWRKGYTYPALDSICSEVMLRFGALPRWEEYVQAARQGWYGVTDEIKIEHQAWRKQIREFCLERGITTFPKQSAQFLKFYFAWHRWQYEERHGVITRKYARQMM